MQVLFLHLSGYNYQPLNQSHQLSYVADPGALQRYKLHKLTVCRSIKSTR